MQNNDSLLVVAALLGAAAYILSEESASAGSAGSSGVNGFAINNPGNIRYNAANQWQGQTGSQNGFCVFDTLADGVRAMGILLTNYYQSGLQTITQIISKYAPASENDTDAYILDVSNRTGDSADEPLQWPDDEVSLIQAIVWHEQGNNPMSDADVQGYI